MPGAAARLAHRRCRSRAWAHTRNQPRACETRGRKRHGARLARRSRATCPPQVCPPQARGCAGLFPLIFRLFLFGFLPLKSLFTCRSGRDGPLLSSEKKVDKDSQRGLAPLNPHSCALRPIFSSSALLAGLRGLSAANRRLTGKRLKSQGAELSFSSVSVRRGTPAPCGRSFLLPRCWPAYAAFRPQTAG